MYYMYYIYYEGMYVCTIYNPYVHLKIHGFSMSPMLLLAQVN